MNGRRKIAYAPFFFVLTFIAILAGSLAQSEEFGGYHSERLGEETFTFHIPFSFEPSIDQSVTFTQFDGSGETVLFEYQMRPNSNSIYPLFVMAASINSKASKGITSQTFRTMRQRARTMTENKDIEQYNKSLFAETGKGKLDYHINKVVIFSESENYFATIIPSIINGPEEKLIQMTASVAVHLGDKIFSLITTVVDTDMHPDLIDELKVMALHSKDIFLKQNH